MQAYPDAGVLKMANWELRDSRRVHRQKSRIARKRDDLVSQIRENLVSSLLRESSDRRRVDKSIAFRKRSVMPTAR